jgi:hypothetical protein
MIISFVSAKERLQIGPFSLSRRALIFRHVLVPCPWWKWHQLDCKWMWVSSLRRVPCYAWVFLTIFRTPRCWYEAWIGSALSHRTCAMFSHPKCCNCMQNWHYDNAELASIPRQETYLICKWFFGFALDFHWSLCTEKTYLLHRYAISLRRWLYSRYRLETI